MTKPDEALLWARERWPHDGAGFHNSAAEAYRAGHSAAAAQIAELSGLLTLAHDTMHETTAVLSANDCAKVAAVMAEIRAALEGKQ